MRSCIKAITFCSTESQADLQDYVQNKLKNLENELIVKLKSAMKEVAVCVSSLYVSFNSAMENIRHECLQAGDDEYSLLVNLKRFYELQLAKLVSSDGLYEDMANILRDLKDMDNEACKELFEGTFFIFQICLIRFFISFQVKSFLLLNMYLHVAWCLQSLDRENPSEASVTALLLKRNTLFEQLEYFTETLPEVQKEGRSWGVLSSRVSFHMLNNLQ